MRIFTLLRSPARISLVLLSLSAGVTLIWVARHVRAYADYPPSFDEAVHLLPVVQVGNALLRGDLAGFWQATIQQEQLAAYPFVHSWLAAPVWMLRPGLTAQRWFSLGSVFFSVLLAFSTGHLLAGQRRWLSGLVSGALVLTAFPLWVYGSLAYLEGVGLLLTLLTIYCYLRSVPQTAGSSERRVRRRFLVATSVAATAAFLTKYNFGLYLLGAIACNEGFAWLQQRRTLPWKRWAYLFLPAVVVLLVWFAAPGRWQRFLSFGQAQQGPWHLSRWESWLYYPLSFSNHYVAGLPALLLIIGGAAYALWHWHEGRFRFLLLYLAVSGLAIMIVPQKEPRFLYTIAPVAMLPAGPFSAWLWAWARRYGRQAAVLLAAAFLLLAIWWGAEVLAQFRYLAPALDVAYESPPSTRAGYDWIAEQTLAEGGRVYLLNGWHLFNRHTLQWNQQAAQGFPPHPLDVDQVQGGLAPEPTASNLESLVQEWHAQAIGYVVTIDGSPAGSYTGWEVVEPLLAQGILEPVSSSDQLTLRAWDEAYRNQLLAAAFASREEWQALHAARSLEFDIRLHLYRVRN